MPKTYTIGGRTFHIPKLTLYQHEKLNEILTAANARLEYSLENGAEIVLAIGTLLQRLLDAGKARDTLIYLLAPAGKAWEEGEMEACRNLLGQVDEETLTEILADFFVIRTVSMSASIASLMTSLSEKKKLTNSSGSTASPSPTGS